MVLFAERTRFPPSKEHCRRAPPHCALIPLRNGLPLPAHSLIAEHAHKGLLVTGLQSYIIIDSFYCETVTPTQAALCVLASKCHFVQAHFLDHLDLLGHFQWSDKTETTLAMSLSNC